MNTVTLWILIVGLSVQVLLVISKQTNTVGNLVIFYTYIRTEQTSSAARSRGPAIAALARDHIGSTEYPYTDNLWDWMLGDSYRGHLFVSDVLQTIGVRVPIRKLPSHPILAEDWDDKQSPLIQIISMCWRTCWDNPRPGDIIAYDGLVGICTGRNKITYSDPTAQPPGLIIETQSKYVHGHKGTCWRLIC